MAINTKNAELMGIYQGLKPENVVSTYYQDKFRNDYSTKSATLVFDDLVGNLKSLAIVPRNTKAPVIKEGEFIRNTFTPDIIKGSAPLTPDELFAMQAGESPILFKGQSISKADQIRDGKLKSLKLAYIATKEKMAAEIYLTGKLTMPETGRELVFDETTNTSKNLVVTGWQEFILELVEEFAKDNGFVPTRIELGSAIFKELMKDKDFAKLITAYNQANVADKDTGYKNIYPSYNLLGYRLDVLPPTNLYSGNLDTSNLVIVSSDVEFVNTYVGLTVINNDKVEVVETDVYIDYDVDKPTTSQSYILTSGYLPVIPISKRVKRYNLTVKLK